MKNISDDNRCFVCGKNNDRGLQFYFRYIAGFREADELKEEVDPALFGTLLHESIRKIYKKEETLSSRPTLSWLLKMRRGSEWL